jgi:hypothetical protein
MGIQAFRALFWLFWTVNTIKYRTTVDDESHGSGTQVVAIESKHPIAFPTPELLSSLMGTLEDTLMPRKLPNKKIYYQ